MKFVPHSVFSLRRISKSSSGVVVKSLASTIFEVWSVGVAGFHVNRLSIALLVTPDYGC